MPASRALSSYSAARSPGSRTRSFVGVGRLSRSRRTPEATRVLNAPCESKAFGSSAMASSPSPLGTGLEFRPLSRQRGFGFQAAAAGAVGRSLS